MALARGKIDVMFQPWRTSRKTHFSFRANWKMASKCGKCAGDKCDENVYFIFSWKFVRIQREASICGWSCGSRNIYRQRKCVHTAQRAADTTERPCGKLIRRITSFVFLRIVDGDAPDCSVIISNDNKINHVTSRTHLQRHRAWCLLRFFSRLSDCLCGPKPKCHTKRNRQRISQCGVMSRAFVQVVADRICR